MYTVELANMFEVLEREYTQLNWLTCLKYGMRMCTGELCV